MYTKRSSANQSGVSGESASSSISGTCLGDLSDSRKRQSKRDEAIRRKIENDLSKKKRAATRTSRKRSGGGAPGTVLSLRPSEPIVCSPKLTVHEASQLMSAKRENCILVEQDQTLLGIFTARDLAFRVVALGLNPNSTTIDQIMTPNPQCATSTTAALEALNLMVEKGFRHLPVLDDNSQLVVGVLDITKCYAQQMEKLERMHASSKRLYEALDSVQSEMGVHDQPLQVLEYFEDLRAKMNGPTLEDVLANDSSTLPVYANVKLSVYEAAVLMKENHTTAVLVRDNGDDVSGIFTSKDVVLRVIAAGLDPRNCSVVRVMTPQPDVALHKMSIQDALRKMFDGHYLNLPVVDEGDIVGIVDVLRLTHTTLSQIRLIELQPHHEQQLSRTASVGEGPAWNKFWTSLDDDSESVNSDTLTHGSGAPPDAMPDTNAFNVDIQPSDSVSHATSPMKPKQRPALSTGDEITEEDEARSTFLQLSTLTFKFKSPTGRVHRFALAAADGVDKLHQMIDSKLHSRDFELLAASVEEPYAISYLDDEGDMVSITTDHDLVECVKINWKLKTDRADLYIHNIHEPPTVKRRARDRGSQVIPGLNNEVLILGAVAMLGAAAVVGWVIGRK
jgi:CBS domain-containing protein